MLAILTGFSMFVVLVFLLFMALFILVGFPLWMLFDCLKSRFVSGALKVLWLFSILMAWPFGSLAYASFASQKERLARFSNLLVVFLIAAILLFSLGVYYFRSEFLPRSVAIYQKRDLKGLAADKQSVIKSNLVVLQNEMQANSFFSERSLIALQLFELFQAMAQNSRVTSEEWDLWSKQFDLREKVRTNNLTDYVSSLNRLTLRQILTVSKET